MSSFLPDKSARPIDTTSAVEFVGAPTHPDAMALLEYWNGKRGGRAMPDRADINPSDLVRLLPSLGIIEAIDGGRDFRFRLYGSMLADQTGIDRTGELFSELEPAPHSQLSAAETRKRWLDVAQMALAAARPVFVTMKLVATDRVSRVAHAVVLPMTAGGETVAQFLGGSFIAEMPPES